MRVAHLKGGAGLGARLLNRRLYKLVEELRKEDAECETEALDLSPEEEVGDEAADADEYRDQRDPGEEVAEGVAPLVPDVGERHRLEQLRRRWDGFHGVKSAVVVEEEEEDGDDDVSSPAWLIKMADARICRWILKRTICRPGGTVIRSEFFNRW